MDISEVQLIYRKQLKSSQLKQITSSREVCKFLRDSVYDANTLELRESFKILFTNQANRVLGVMHLSEGGISETCVDVRLILQAAILSNSSGIIVSHNHPSGNLFPSTADESFTRKLKEAVRYFDIRLLDHIILTEESYYSFADEGKL